LILTLSVCSIAALALIWRYDLYDKEPWWALLIAAGLGFIGMDAIEPVQVWFAGWMGAEPVRFALIASLTEEALKLACVIAVAVMLRRVFNDPVDGIIYGSVVGFGCAIEESIAYFYEPVSRPWGPGQEVIRLLGHLIFGGLSGFGVGLIVCKGVARRRAWLCFALGFSTALLLHFLWDVLASRMLVRSRPTNVDRVLQILLMLAGLIAYAAALKFAWTDACRAFEGEHWKRLLWAPTKRQRATAPVKPRMRRKGKRTKEQV
jgi:RsiW-degrading membrane proteinase PrsW (M82 family)